MDCTHLNRKIQRNGKSYIHRRIMNWILMRSNFETSQELQGQFRVTVENRSLVSSQQ